jgi:signal transduction histidine kinase
VTPEGAAAPERRRRRLRLRAGAETRDNAFLNVPYDRRYERLYLASIDISLQLRLAEDLPRVLGDGVQLQQVVLNLLVNARQAMADVVDGPRVLRIETREPKPGSIEISVADTGAGVDGSELERMFEPFVSSKAEGLGMGLSINRSIVEAHGGHIAATRNRDRV